MKMARVGMQNGVATAKGVQEPVRFARRGSMTTHVHWWLGLHVLFALLQPVTLLTLKPKGSCRPPVVRRSLFEAVASFSSFGLLSVSLPANAAAPITRGEADNVGAQTVRRFRPKPPKSLRPRLDTDFAVLLMRSSYSTLDQLDCVAMDQFQRDFFIVRQGRR